MASTRLSAWDNTTARFAVVVLFPSPSVGLAIANTFISR